MGRMTIYTYRTAAIVFLLIAFSTNAFAQPGDTDTLEVGTGFPGGPPPDPYSGYIELNTALDLGINYTHFSGEDMSGSYGGIPELDARISWAMGDRSRFFLSVGYGRKCGDPYWDIEHFDSDQNMTVQTMPFLMGIKFNASTRKNVRLYFGAAAQLTYAWETLPTGISNGEATTSTSSGLITGYYLFVGPEFPLGQGTDAVGLEFGIGGTKGEISAAGNRHDIDLTGYRVRAFYSFEL